MEYIEQIDLNEIIVNYLPDIRVVPLQSGRNSLKGAPLVVVPQENGYGLVDGRRRWQSWSAAGQTFQAVLCMDSAVSLFEAWLERLKLNALSLTVLDWIYIVRQTRLQPKWDFKPVWDLACLWLNAREQEQLKVCSELPESVWEAIVAHKLKIEQVMFICQRSQADLPLWVELIVATGMNHNETKTLWQYCDHIQKREQWTLQQLWDNLKFDSLLHSDVSEREKYRQLQQCLWQKRFPIRHQTEYEIKTFCQRLGLPRNIDLIFPENLEGDCIHLQIRASDPDQLNQALQWLQTHKEKLNDVFSWI